jgi:hypothetical protein
MHFKPGARAKVVGSKAALLGVLIAMTVASGFAGEKTAPTRVTAVAAPDPVEGPLSFEPNVGQAGRQVHFIARGPGYTLCLTHDAALISLETYAARTRTQSPSLSIQLVGAKSALAPVPKNELRTKSSYFFGPDPKNWHSEIPTFERVEFRDVYAGIDVAYHGTQGRLEYEFVVAAGAAPGRIVMSLSGPGGLLLDAHGDVLLRTEQMDVRFHKPTARQVTEGNPRTVSARYALRDRQIRVVVGAYDSSKPLVIAPVLSYAIHTKARNVSDARPK